MAEQADGQPSGQRLSTWLDVAIDVARSISWQTFAALGILAYGVLRIVFGLFYGSFGVRPEEVGYGYADALTQSTAAVLLVVLLALINLHLLSLVYLLWSLVKIDRELTSELKRAVLEVKEHGWNPLLKWLAHRLGTIALLSFGVVFTDQLEGRQWWEGVLGGGLLLAWLIVIGGNYPNPLPSHVLPETRQDSWRREMSQWAKRLVPWVTIFSFLVLAGPLPIRATQDAAAAKNGSPVPSSGRFLGLFPPWSAQPAVLFWIATPPAALLNSNGRCIMYLGRADNIVVVYDVMAKRTLRIPAQAVLLSMREPVERGVPGCGE
jgi:hypothetical protein